MIQEIRDKLLNNPDIICNVLHDFDFYKMSIHNDRISFANSEDGSSTSISMKLNQDLFTRDFVRDISGDVFSFVMKSRGKTFKEVIDVVKENLGITVFKEIKKAEPFGGLFKKCRRRNNTLEYKTYSDVELERYAKGYNMRFFRDHIDLSVQSKFGLRYDTNNNGIIIPIRSPVGELMGIKMRKNYNVTGDESKYIYVLPCPVSQTLYGYSQNYSSLYNEDILIGESEKFVMQCASYGYNNAVGLGSSNLSNQQCKLLLSLNPKSISFMLDVGLNKDVLYKNMNMIKSYNPMIQIPIYYWNEKDFGDKESCTDRGKDMFIKALSDREGY